MRNESPAWKNIGHLLRFSAPSALLIVFLILGFVSFSVPYLGPAKLQLVLMYVFYWAIYRPAMVPPALCFSAGFIMDVLSGGVLGVHALVLVSVQWAVRTQRRFLMGQPYTTTWAVFALVLLLATFAQWGLSGLAFFRWAPVLPVAGSALINLFAFPFITLLFVAVHRMLPVARHAFARVN